MIGFLIVGLLSIAMGVLGLLKRQGNADARLRFFERFGWLPFPRSRRYHLIEQTFTSLIMVGVGLAVVVATLWSV